MSSGSRARKFPQSDAYWARAQTVIPRGTQTISKSPRHWVEGAVPIYLQRGEGAHVWDVDGNEWIDFPMALGPMLLGYQNEAVDDAIQRQLRHGVVFTLMHPLEVEVAERIVAMCAGVEAVRFAKTGSDAVSAAVRVARAFTQRDHVLFSGYHGWHDWYVGATSEPEGVPASTRELASKFTFNDLDMLEGELKARDGSIAAVVVEAAAGDAPVPGFFEGVIELACRHGAVSIFDEMITGFRIAPGGVRERYGVEPDMSCYGKALGNGMPIAAVGGRADVMQTFERVWVSGTHLGEALSLAAAKAVLEIIADGVVLEEMRAMGAGLLRDMQVEVARSGLGEEISVGGEPHRPLFSFRGDRSDLLRSWIIQCMAAERVLFNGSMFICARHSETDIAAAVRGLSNALDVAASGEDLASLLVGPVAAPLFRR